MQNRRHKPLDHGHRKKKTFLARRTCRYTRPQLRTPAPHFVRARVKHTETHRNTQNHTETHRNTQKHAKQFQAAQTKQRHERIRSTQRPSPEKGKNQQKAQERERSRQGQARKKEAIFIRVWGFGARREYIFTQSKFKFE